MADITPDQISKIVQSAMFDAHEWASAGRDFARGMEDGSRRFSSINRTGVAGGRGSEGEAPSFRTLESEYQTEIKLKKLANDKTSKMLKAFEEARKDISPQVKGFQSHISVLTQALDSHFDRLNASFETAAKEIKFWEKIYTEHGATIFDLENELKVLQTRLRDVNITEEERIGVETKLLGIEDERAQILEKGSKKLERHGKGITALGAAAVAVGQALRQVTADLQAQRRFAAPGTFGEQFRAGLRPDQLMGIDPQLVAELMATNRTALIAMGGHRDMSEYYSSLGERINELTDLTGTRTEALKFEISAFQNLVRAGIHPTQDALQDQVDSLKFARKAMGMTSDEFNQLQTQLVTDVEFRKTLNGLNAQERRNRLRRMNDQIAINRANGMMRDNAIAAAQALEQMAGQGPRERIKQMAKLQAVAATAGVQMSEEARMGFIRGRAANEEQRKAQQTFMSAMGDRMTEISATMGGTAMEFAIFGALDKTGISMEQFDVHLTNLGKDIAELSDDFEDEFTTTTENLGTLGKAFNEATKWFEAGTGVIRNIAGGGIIESVLGGVGTGLATFFGVKAAGGVGAGLGGLGLGAVGTALGVTAAAGGGLAAGGLLGTGINKLPELFGFDAVSTNIVDGLERVFGEPYDPNADVVASKTARNTEEIVEPTRHTAENTMKQLSEAEKHTELLKLIAELTSGMVTNQSARDRLSRLTVEGQKSTLANQ